jgi:CheY-like chemotaxis protein
MSAILLSRNLLSSSRVAAAARACGLPLQTVRQLEQIPPEQLGQLKLVLIDLSEPAFDPAQIAAQLQEHPQCAADIVAFGPHVDEPRLQAARQAGCHQVLTHGQFDANMSQILGRYA